VSTKFRSSRTFVRVAVTQVRLALSYLRGGSCSHSEALEVEVFSIWRQRHVVGHRRPTVGVIELRHIQFSLITCWVTRPILTLKMTA
jgi:hypothetical protein